MDAQKRDKKVNINNIAHGNVFNAHRSNPHQFSSTSNQQFANVFRRDILSLGNTSSPFQTYSASPPVDNMSARDNILGAIAQTRTGAASVFSAASAVRSNEPFDIRYYYTMSSEEVKQKLDKLTEEIFYETDFFGMTGEEIYKHIEKKYIETFGSDFMIANSLLTVFYNGSPNLSDEDKLSTNFAYVTIGQSFYGAINSLTSHLRGPDSPVTDIIRKSLYGNMSDSEIMDEIMSKYPQPLTNRSLALMNGDLYAVNLGMFDIGRYVDAHIMHPSESVVNGTMPHWTELEKRWTNILNRPANIPLLSAIHNVHLKEAKSNASALPFALQTKEMLVRLGAPLGNDGYFLHKLSKELLLHLFGIADDYDIPGSLDVKVDKDLIDDFMEDLEKHDKDLLDSRKFIASNHDYRKNSKEMFSRLKDDKLMDDEA